MLPVILAVAALAAGHPVAVTCDADTNRPASMKLAPNAILFGWSYAPSNEIHLSTDVCKQLEKPPTLTPNSWPGDVTWAVAWATLIHESKHAAGIGSESCANQYALALTFPYLERFYGLSQFSLKTFLIVREIWRLTDQQAPQYRVGPNACVPT